MNKPRGGYPMQQQQQYRQYPPQGVPQQGPPAGAAPRNPNGPPTMRLPNGPPPRPPQPQQSQIHNQQHAVVTGVQIPHQHPHPATAQQAQSQQQQHHQQMQQQQQQQAQPQQMYPFNNYILHQQSAGAQYTALQFQQQSAYLPQGTFPVRFVAAPHQQLYYSNQGQPPHIYHPQPQQMAQHQHAQQAGYYSPAAHYVQQPRLPVVHHTGQGVQTVQHGPSVPVPQVHPGSHQPQHAPQHPHAHSQVSQPPTAQGQGVNRGESAPAPVPEKKREKKILKIVDPTTGLSVIGDTPTSNPAAPTEPSQRSVTPVEGNGDVTASTASVSGSLEAQQGSGSEASIVEEVTVKKPITKVEKVVSDEPITAVPTEITKSNTARAEFFQKITQASDDARGPNSSISQNASISPPSPTPASTVADEERPGTPPVDSSKSQQAAVTPIANTSCDDSKDSSLVAVSPIPLENYLTPRSSRKSSPPGSVNVESTQEELYESSNEKDKPLPGSTNVEEQKNVQSEVESTIPELSASEVEKSENGGPESIDKEEIDDDKIQSGSEKTESVCDDVPSEEQASVVHQNGDLDLEEGEIVADEDDVGPGIDSGDDELESTEVTEDKKEKKMIKYDRDFLINIGNQVPPTKMPDLFPDVVKDAGNNQMRHHGQQMSKSPGGPRGGDPFNRMRAGQGSKPGLMMGGMNFQQQRGAPGHHGMMNWGGGMAPMMVPPAPPRGPPKVLELTREEVKLHKAENAWKPGVKHRGASNEPKDSEDAITDDIVKKTRGILNKLTPENFEKLVEKFMNLPLEDKEERISKVIKVVFEKAVDEPSFSKEYAKMVFRVCSASQETSKKFRKLILDQCQQEFQKSHTEEDKIKELEEQLKEATDATKKEQLKLELEETKFQMRRRSLGNVRFIGELYKLQMLTPKIMVECVGMLLASPDEENLECLCKLLTTVGGKLDEQLRDIEERYHQMKSQPAAQQRIPKFVPDDKWMAKTVSQLKVLSENMKLSSRIRFALLDAVELRENNWKPRRDANAPKTIDEVRRDAYRQEMEEKRQINNLPPAGTMSDQRGGPSSRQPPGPPQMKKGDWNTVQSNKSSRFQIKKPDQAAALPVLAPPTQTWGRNTMPPVGGGGPSQTTKPPTGGLPPRFNRFQGLSDDRDRLNNSNSGNQQQPLNYRDHLPQAQQYQSAPSGMRRASPAPSNTSSRENSRPVSPKDSTPPVNTSDCTADDHESVKNIFEEYFNVGRFDDTLHWIQKRFPGDKISNLVGELSRQVAEMSKLPEQQKAGSLTRSLIRANAISKDTVLTILAEGVIAELPDIQIDAPMAVNYLAQFLIEVFVDELNLDWLIAIGKSLIDVEDHKCTWEEICSKTINLLKSKSNEQNVQSIFAKTKDKALIPVEDLPWLSSAESLAQKMVPVLKDNLLNREDEIRQVLKENSWDIREELTSRSLVEAICILTWNSETGRWDLKVLEKLLPLLPLPHKTSFPHLWKQACDFVSRNKIDKAQKEELWGVMYHLDLATAPEPTNSD